MNVWIAEDGVEKTIVFSGDIGNDQSAVDTESAVSTSCRLCGDGIHLRRQKSWGPRPDYVKLLAEIIQETFDRGGNLVSSLFCSWAVPRKCCTLSDRSRQIGLIHGHDGFKVFVDSPLANEATRTFLEYTNMTALMRKRWI